MKIGLCFVLLLFASASILSQTPEAPLASSASSGEKPASDGSAPKASVLPDLDRLETVASQVALHIGRLRIDKWKASSGAKSAAQADADSVQRNLSSALPALIGALRSAPEDVNAEFKLYRNLNALYDVFGTLTDATRVFGQKSEYEALSQQLQVISSVRRKLGEGLELLTATRERELNQMRIQIKAQQEQLAAAAAPPKQIVVAQTEPPKKPAPKKKTVAKKPASAASGSNGNSQGSNSTVQMGVGATAPKS
jgi:hypothetical protein